MYSSAQADLMTCVFRQSGQMDRRGHITKRGSRLLRKSLVECGWLLIRYNPWAAQLVQRLSRGQKTRRKQAIVALAFEDEYENTHNGEDWPR